MSDLSYFQRREVEDIVEDRINRKDFWKDITGIYDKFRLEQQIKEKTETVVPQVCQTWVDKNMRNETESITNNFMRNNFRRFFHQEVSENKEVNGFIATHLETVAQQVKTTTDETVSKLVATDHRTNPIFQSHLQILSDRNKHQLDELTRNIRESKETLDRANNENAELSRRVNDLENVNKDLVALSACSFAGFIGLCVALAKRG